ncbi:MAG: hypothetical protein U0401_13710 [Anaerolineae bacterium]
MRDEVILTSSEIFPLPDTTHACLLRATPQTVDRLILDIIDYFKAKSLPTTIFISPACTPPDLAERLLRQGFIKQEAEEAWLTFDNLLRYEVPTVASAMSIELIDSSQALTFAQTFMTAFDMPLDFAPAMLQLLTPSINLPGVYHYLAWLEGQPVGTFSLICGEKIGILGSAGVIPAQRGSKTIFSLCTHVARQAQQHGLDTLILQTTAGALLERFLRINGFKRAFTRIGYTLS